jgi:2,4-dienoyl-CoA reductase-like NADH-dependent reductase (Old Yellow Enzyme family)
MAIAVRLSPERFGMKLDEITEVFGRLVDSRQVDLIDMSLWDVNKEPVEEAHKGRTLTDIFVELPRGATRLAVAGKIHDPADVQRILDRGVDVAVLGRVGILHHDYPTRLHNDPGFAPRRPPVSRDTLLDEGLSPAFVSYMAGAFRGFVQE